MVKAYSYACRDCEGMEACPASIVAETRGELRQLMGHHARIAHQENPADWNEETRDYLETLIKEIKV
jgi:hypothetical protein